MFSHGQLYVALSRTADPRNVFILTMDGFNKTSNVVFWRYLTWDTVFLYFTSQVWQITDSTTKTKNRISVVSLLDPENGLGTEIRSDNDDSNAQKFDEDVISIVDDYKPVFDWDIFQSSTLENPNILEFESVYGLIPERISFGSMSFNKQDIETVRMPQSWVIHNVISEFTVLLNEGNVFAVDPFLLKCCAGLFDLN